MNEFMKWRAQNPYYGKKVSVFSDTLSALPGYIPKGSKPQNLGIDIDRKGVWWDKVIDFLGADLLVNNSSAPFCVASLQPDFPDPECAASSNHIAKLETTNFKPDVILIFLGNDDVHESSLCNDENTWENFAYAYDTFLKKVSCYYPGSDIIVCTLPDYQGVEEYNQAIADAAANAQAKLIDLSTVADIRTMSELPEFMEDISNVILSSLLDEEGKKWLFENPQPSPAVVPAKNIMDELEREETKIPEPKEEANSNGEEGYKIEEEILESNYKEPEKSTEEIQEDPVHELPLSTLDLMNEPKEEAQTPAPSSKATFESEIPVLEADENEDSNDDLLEEIVPEQDENKIRLTFADYAVDDDDLDLHHEEEDDILSLMDEDPKDLDMLSETMSISAPSTKRKVLKRSHHVSSEPKPKKHSYSKQVSLNKVDEDRKMQFNQETIAIGRQMRNNDVILKAPSVSRNHAHLEYENGKWYLEDIGSVNGTILNGEKLEPHEKVQLHNGDLINICNSILQFECQAY